jgi:hypothetical protein
MNKTKVKDVKLSDNHVPNEEVSFIGKTNKELMEVRDTLMTQLNQYQTMAIKAQGALEVVNQLIVEEEEEDDS